MDIISVKRFFETVERIVKETFNPKIFDKLPFETKFINNRLLVSVDKEDLKSKFENFEYIYIMIMEIFEEKYEGLDYLKYESLKAEITEFLATNYQYEVKDNKLLIHM